MCTTTNVTEIQETYFEIKTSIMSIGFSFLNISNCQSVLKYLSLYGIFLYLDDSCITKFDFVNYAFAQLVVAWLYVTNCKIIGQNVVMTQKYLICTVFIS